MNNPPTAVGGIFFFQTLFCVGWISTHPPTAVGGILTFSAKPFYSSLKCIPQIVMTFPKN
jgi:hypothetical protein